MEETGCWEHAIRRFIYRAKREKQSGRDDRMRCVVTMRWDALKQRSSKLDLNIVLSISILTEEN